MGKNRIKKRVCLSLAADIAHHPSRISLELSQALARTLELLRMSIALLLDQLELSHPGVGLAQADERFARFAAVPLASFPAPLIRCDSQ